MVNIHEPSDVAVGFQIQELRVTSYSINEEHLQKGDEVGFGIELQHLFNGDNDRQVVRVELEIGHNPKEIMVTLHLECEYQLAGYRNWLEAQTEGHTQLGILPSGLAMALNSISLSTARGVLFERLKGTTLQRILLPIVDPSAFQIAS